MAALKDLNKLIHHSHVSFNEARATAASTLDADHPSIRSHRKITRDLSHHNLGGTFFYGTTFEGVKFGSLEDVTFNGCVFIECDFGPSPNNANGKAAACRDLVFFECEFDRGIFARQTLHNCSIIQPTLVKPPVFDGAILESKFVYEHERINLELIDYLVEAETAPRCEIQVVGEASYPRGSWETIRFIAKLPFLQVSFVGIIAVSALAVLVGNIEAPLISLSITCSRAMEDHPEAQTILSGFCNQLSGFSLSSGILESLQFMFLNFLAIFLGALIQSSICPNEVTEFSRAYWTRQLRRPAVFYTALAHRARSWMIVAASLQAIGIGFFLYRAVEAFFKTFS